MTLLLLAAGAALAAAGTRLAVGAFAAAAVLGAGLAELPAATTWTAVMLVGFGVTPVSPRRLALPAVGAAAVLAAGSAPNAAVVTALWVLGTTAAVLSVPRSAPATRWALTVCVTDLGFAAAAAIAAFGSGFQTWPTGAGTLPAVLMIAAGLAKAPLASGPDDQHMASGLIVVRAQSAVLIVTGCSALGSVPGLLQATTVVGAALFAGGAWARRPGTRDTAQEGGLLAMVVGLAALGVAPTGWEWGVHAGGTLIHNLRLRLVSGSLGEVSALVTRSPLIVLALLPAIQVALEGATRADPWLRLVVLGSLVGGLVLRAMAGVEGRKVARREGGPVAVVLGVAGVGAAVWAPVLTVPSGAGGDAISWPPGWAAAAVPAAGLAWYLASRRGHGVGAEDGPATRGRAPSLPDPLLPSRVAVPTVVWAGVGVLGLTAAGLWVLGVLRGFL